MELTEQEFRALRNGDPKAFEKLYLHYEKPVYYFLLAKTNGDETAAEDVFSDTFTSAFGSLARLGDQRNIQGWLLRIASRRLSDYLRRTYRERKKKRSLHTSDKVGEGVLDDLLQREEKAMFQLAAERLKPEYHRALRLKYYERKSVSEIAGLYGVVPTTVEGLLRRSRKAFRRALAELGYL
jgi:RNA polymerase sigma factor (sigma-70 family)